MKFSYGLIIILNVTAKSGEILSDENVPIQNSTHFWNWPQQSKLKNFMRLSIAFVLIILNTF